ncbi:MAG: hypothetical protein Alpg2KO_18110 [Alphaproteobacteria bacterium]
MPATQTTETATQQIRSAPEELANQDGLKLTFGWGRATTPSMTASAAYVTFWNSNDFDDRLISATSPRADMVELHGMEMKDGVMRMFPLADGIDLPAGKEVALQPGGTHLMLMGLKSQIKQGETIQVTLTFETADPITVDLGVMPLNYLPK